MGELKNSTAAVLSATENLVSVDTKNEAAMFAALAAFAETGVSLSDISKGGELLPTFQAGILVGWQGAEFAEAFVSAKSGKVLIRGKVRDRATRRMSIAEMPKVDWQRQLSSKVSKYRAIIAEYIGESLDGADKGKAKAGKGKGKAKGKAGKRGSRAGSAPRNLAQMMGDKVDDWAKRLDAVAAGVAKPAGDAEAFSGDIAPVREALKVLAKALKEAK